MVARLTCLIAITLLFVHALTSSAEAFRFPAKSGSFPVAVSGRFKRSLKPTPTLPSISHHRLSSLLTLRSGASPKDHGRVHVLTKMSEMEALFKQAKEQKQLVVVDFSASWCGPCQRIGPIFSQLSTTSEFSDVVFVKVDVDDGPDIAAEFAIQAMPTFLFWKDGGVVNKMMGANPQGLVDSIRKYK